MITSVLPSSIKSCYQKSANKNEPKYAINLQPSDKVSFSGAMKVLSNPLDKAMVEILSTDLKLNGDEVRKLKNLVWDYLRKYKISSLGDHGGEEFFNEQVELSEAICNKLKIQDEYIREYVGVEVINRADKGENYIPYGMKEFDKQKALEESFAKSFKIGGVANSFGKLMSKMADDDMYAHICKALRFNTEECVAFRGAVDKFLRENNIEKIEDMAGEDFLCEQAELATLLERKFNLSEDETTLVNWELIARANSKMGMDYSPETSVYVKDRRPLISVVENLGFDYAEEPLKQNSSLFRRPAKMFSTSLYRIMDKEANERGFKYIFDIFNPDNNPLKSESYKFIMNSKLSNNDANDLVIKLVEMSECHEEYAKDLPKHVMRDNFYADIKDMMMTDKIIGAFSIDNNCSKVLKEMISKIHPAHVSDGEAYSLQRVAYEIADKFKLPVGAEEKIVKSMQEIQSAPEKEADAYFIKRLSNASAEYDSLSEGI